MTNRYVSLLSPCAIRHSRRPGRNQAELLKHAEIVANRGVLGNLAARYPETVELENLYRFAGGRDTGQHAAKYMG